MNIQNQKLTKIAEDIRNVYITGQQIAPVRESEPDFTLEEAYTVQLMNETLRVRGGDAVVGWKIGLCDKALQISMGAREPDRGPLYSSGLAAGDTAGLRLFQPKVEAEIAFVMGRDLGEGADESAVLEATEYITAAYEVVDTRIKDWNNTVRDSVADGASGCGFALGDVHMKPTADTKLISAVMRKNGETVARGDATAVMGDPLSSVAWLANDLAKNGRCLSRGDIVLSGALAGAVPVSRGDVVETEFSGLGTLRLEIK